MRHATYYQKARAGVNLGLFLSFSLFNACLDRQDIFSYTLFKAPSLAKD